MKVNLKRIVILSLMVMLCSILATSQRRAQRSRRSPKAMAQHTPRMTRHTPKVGERETVTNPRNPDEYEPGLNQPEQADVISSPAGANARPRIAGSGNSNQGNSNAATTPNDNDEGIARRFVESTKPTQPNAVLTVPPDVCPETARSLAEVEKESKEFIASCEKEIRYCESSLAETSNPDMREIYLSTIKSYKEMIQSNREELRKYKLKAGEACQREKKNE